MKFDSQNMEMILDIYLAGGIEHAGWRHSQVDGLRKALVDPAPFIPALFSPEGNWPILLSAIRNQHNYVGPHFISCDHGCFHGPQTAGLGLGQPTCASEEDNSSIALENRRKKVFELNKDAIERADFIFAWIDRTELYGTLVEIGYALGRNKHVAIAFAKNLSQEVIDEHWFVCQGVQQVFYDCENVGNALDKALVREIKSRFLFKKIISQYAGKCRECGKNHLPRDEVYWCVEREVSGIWCLSCKSVLDSMGTIIE